MEFKGTEPRIELQGLLEAGGSRFMIALPEQQLAHGRLGDGKLRMPGRLLLNLERVMRGTKRTQAEPVYAEDGTTVLYYTGKIEVRGKEPVRFNRDYKTISEFSSWGVPGDLTLKPEIAAPGGNCSSRRMPSTAASG